MFANKCYAKVWDDQTKVVKERLNRSLKISVSKKNEDGSYTQEFNGFVKLLDDAATKVVLKDEKGYNNSIQLLNVGVTSTYNKEKQEKNVNCYVTAFNNSTGVAGGISKKNPLWGWTFTNGAYARVWEVTQNEKGKTIARITISGKKGDSYVTYFNDYVQVSDGVTVTENSTIKIESCGTRNWYNKENKKTYWTFYVFKATPVTDATEPDFDNVIPPEEVITEFGMDFPFAGDDENEIFDNENTSDVIMGNGEDLPFK